MNTESLIKFDMIGRIIRLKVPIKRKLSLSYLKELLK